MDAIIGMTVTVMSGVAFWALVVWALVEVMG